MTADKCLQLTLIQQQLVMLLHAHQCWRMALPPIPPLDSEDQGNQVIPRDPANQIDQVDSTDSMDSVDSGNPEDLVDPMDPEQANGIGRCHQQHCVRMRKLWTHIKMCQDGVKCSEPHCVSSRRILKHWLDCYKTRENCPLCSPLKYGGCDELQDILHNYLQLD